MQHTYVIIKILQFIVLWYFKWQYESETVVYRYKHGDKKPSVTASIQTFTKNIYVSCPKPATFIWQKRQTSPSGQN